MGFLKKYKRRRRKREQRARFLRQFLDFEKMAEGAEIRLPLCWEDRWPVFGEDVRESTFDRHYIYHTAWATRVLVRTNPALHVDVSSSIYFVALASAVIPIRQYEFRPPNIALDQLETIHGSLQGLPIEDHSLQSISCMHAVEHVGLGRYGDPLDPDGDIKAMRELQRVVAPGGQLLFVVPIGRARIQFNAHRIYSYRSIVEQFSQLELKEFALIPDSPETGHLLFGASAELCDQQELGCGCFLFMRPEESGQIA